MAAQLTYSHHVQEHHQEEWYAAQEGDYIRQYRLCWICLIEDVADAGTKQYRWWAIEEY